MAKNSKPFTDLVYPLRKAEIGLFKLGIGWLRHRLNLFPRYILDLSTNGTFLNAVRLPKTGKVALFHGDDLSFPEPGKPQNLGEFGYIVNLEFTWEKKGALLVVFRVYRYRGYEKIAS